MTFEGKESLSFEDIVSGRLPMLQQMVQQPMHRLSRLDSEELEVGRELGCGKLEAVEGGNGG